MTMPSNWFYPLTVTQYTESDQHIPWTGVGDSFTEMNLVRSQTDLKTITNDYTNGLKSKTYYLVCNNFNFRNLPVQVNGIELLVNIRRGGRIIDDTIALHNGHTPIGDNKASGFVDGYGNLTVINQTVYGGETDLWNWPNFTVADLNNNFGILLRYQSHPRYPHATTAFMAHVQLRLW